MGKKKKAPFAPMKKKEEDEYARGPDHSEKGRRTAPLKKRRDVEFVTLLILSAQAVKCAVLWNGE